MSYRSNRAPRPVTPGLMLAAEFLWPLRMSQRELAEHIGCDIKVINRIVKGRASVTPMMALKLAAAFDTTPEFWLDAQTAMDLYHARHRIGRLPDLVMYDRSSSRATNPEVAAKRIPK